MKGKTGVFPAFLEPSQLRDAKSACDATPGKHFGAAPATAPPLARDPLLRPSSFFSGLRVMVGAMGCDNQLYIGLC
jgi:hypothetical protein